MKEILLTTNSAYRYNLYGSIKFFSTYEDFIERAGSYSENDGVLLYINSPGGCIDVGVTIITAIQECRAHVTAIVEAPSCSMASVIAMACDSLVICDDAHLMFHNYSVGQHGKGAEFMMSAAQNDDYIDRIFTKYCYPFLTKAELKRIRNDADIYIQWNDESLQKRKERHYK